MAALFGFRFRKNFDRPFGATSLTQLWQRWHISLSTWLRDYLYRALRGDKRDSGARTYRNIFLTMLLGGMWHGANWTFVIWGAIHGIGLLIERFVKTHLACLPRGAAAPAKVGAAAVADIPSPAANRSRDRHRLADHLSSVHAVGDLFRSPDSIRRSVFRRHVCLPGRGAPAHAVPFDADRRLGSAAVPVRHRIDQLAEQTRGLPRPCSDWFSGADFCRSSSSARAGSPRSSISSSSA